MQFNYRYYGGSQVSSSAHATALQFAPDTLRDPTYFVADLAKHIPFREAISALHQVVVSDLGYKPKERGDYQAWLKAHENALLAEFMAQKDVLKERIEILNRELGDLRQQSAEIMAPFYKARRKYFRYLFTHDYNAWVVLDPVISVHPDEVSFECFSLDESSYGRLSCSLNVFKEIAQFACGTTNIDYSDGLYAEFQKIRDYKRTAFQIDPGGFEVATAQEELFSENKIDLPESWVRGFLQVSAAMNLPMKTIVLHPLDIHNFCFLLRRRKEKMGPRSMRFVLKPDGPVRVVFEPWNIEVECPRSVYRGSTYEEIRIWGRRRIHILERLIPIAARFELHLLGTGMPSFFVAHMEEMSFTLGLPGWTANDWSRMGNFDLMAPRAQVDDITKGRVFKALKAQWFASADALADSLKLDPDKVLGALRLYTQAARVMYDLNKKVFRVRELSREPLPFDTLRYASEREAKADRFMRANLVALTRQDLQEGQLSLDGTVMDNAVQYEPRITIDADQRLVQGECGCHFYVHHKLYKGPCEHMLALRMQHYADRAPRTRRPISNALNGA
jgi:hypothetical protein